MTLGLVAFNFYEWEPKTIIFHFSWAGSLSWNRSCLKISLEHKPEREPSFKKFVEPESVLFYSLDQEPEPYQNLPTNRRINRLIGKFHLLKEQVDFYSLIHQPVKEHQRFYFILHTFFIIVVYNYFNQYMYMIKYLWLLDTGYI